MMGLSFGMSDVRRWAHFSQDYNPIHFDLPHAKLAGLDSLVVHGMLVLLPVKQAVTDAFVDSGGANGRWTKFRALFRNAVLHDRSSALTLRSTDRRIDFRLLAADSGKEHFRGTCSSSGELPITATAEDWLESTLDSDHLEERMLRFINYYPFVKRGWIALDAIIFADFIRTKLKAIEAMTQPYVAKMPGGKVLVQVSQTVFIDKDLIGEDVDRTRRLQRVTYKLARPELIPGDDQLIGTVLLPVLQDQRQIMLLELGLMVKGINDRSQHLGEKHHEYL